MRLFIPADDVLETFNSIVEPIYNLEIGLRKKNFNLRVQRDLLLPKLVSGELDVSDLLLPDKDAAAA